LLPFCQYVTDTVDTSLAAMGGEAASTKKSRDARSASAVASNAKTCDETSAAVGVKPFGAVCAEEAKSVPPHVTAPTISGNGVAFAACGTSCTQPAAAARVGLPWRPCTAADAFKKSGDPNDKVEALLRQNISETTARRPSQTKGRYGASPALSFQESCTASGGFTTVREDWTGQGVQQLSVRSGSKIEISEMRGDWAWCKLDVDACGWVPRRCLELGNRGHDCGKSCTPITSGAGDAGDGSGGCGKASGGGICSGGSGSGSNSSHNGNSCATGDDPTAPGLPEQWTARLAETMVLHTVQNTMRLARYLLQLLTGGYGTTSALHIACWEGSPTAVAVVASGSSNLAKDYHSRAGELTPLHIAAICGHCSVVEYLLHLDIECNVPTVHGLRAMHIAASSSFEVSECLVGGKADVTVLTADEDTPLHFACCYEQIPIIELLLEAAADATAANTFGVTPLHVAVAYAALEGTRVRDAHAVLRLCERSADPQARDRHGRTPAAVARAAGGDATLIEFLCGRASDASSTVGAGPHDATPHVHRQRLAREMLDSSGASDAEEPEPSPSPGCDENGGVEGARDLNDVSLDSGLNSGSTESRWLRPSRQHRQITADTRLEEENAELACKANRLEKELEEARSNGELLRELLDNAQGTMQQMQEMQSTSATSQKQQIEEKQVQITQVHGELEMEREELRQCRQRLDVERRRRIEEGAGVNRQLEEALAARDTALEEARCAAASCEVLASRVAALEVATAAVAQTPKPLSRPPSAVAPMEGEVSEKRAEQCRKDAELQGLRLELCQRTAQLEEARTALMRQETDLESLRCETQRLSQDLERQVHHHDGVSVTLSQLRTAHARLLEDYSGLQLSSQQAHTAFHEHQLTLESQVREHELRNRKMEQDSIELADRLREMEGLREKSERVDRMLPPLEKRICELQSAFESEHSLRKRYHNQLQDLKGAIRVYARVRPVVDRELGQAIAVRKLDSFSLEVEVNAMRSPKSFSFDSVFDERSTQEDIFSECQSLVSSAIDGFNVTIFAYGQTGAGKTHTMYGNDEMPGLVPRIAEELFAIFGRYGCECQTQTRCSMLELYRDSLVDLLLPKDNSKSPPPLDIRRDTRGSVYVENSTEVEIATCDMLLETIRRGHDRRHTAATKMNSDSSRSHLIVTIVIESLNKKTKQVAIGKLTLCDLAGSERLKKSEATGNNMKEAQSINKSLSALGDVIEALTQNAKHVPYRNHKLTQLLSDSLGGNAKTLMFVNCSPVAEHAEETNAALGYAARAKLIVNKIEKNQDSQEVARLKKVLQVMNQELEQARKHAAVVQSLPKDPGTANGPEPS